MCPTDSSHHHPEPYSSSSSEPPDAAILSRLVDAHAHPTDGPDKSGVSTMDKCGLKAVCVMSSTLVNQDDTSALYKRFPEHVIPCFGVHPWFLHSLTDDPSATKESHYSTIFPSDSLPEYLSILPPPSSLSSFLSALESNLASHPTSILGEIGLDKSFNIPYPRSDPTNERELVKRTTLSTPMSHQVKIAEAQIEVALKLRKNISFHSVRAAQDTVMLLERMKKKPGWDRIHICLHSFGGSEQTAVQIQKAHPNVFFSLSTVVNGRSPRFMNLIKSVESHRLLLESDWYKDLDAKVWEMFLAVKEAKGWTSEDAIKTLEENWEKFCSTPEPQEPKLTRKERRKQATDARAAIESDSEEL
ncbi:TatD DNase family Scn1 [Pseudohyphozyma bogoriensis]|nr:TatD DNase family Scn1 [Pseudohyphozyma bogoriensis]